MANQSNDALVAQVIEISKAAIAASDATTSVTVDQQGGEQLAAFMQAVYDKLAGFYDK